MHLAVLDTAANKKVCEPPLVLVVMLSVDVVSALAIEPCHSRINMSDLNYITKYGASCLPPVLYMKDGSSRI
jgi:hypothetical protein